MWNSFYIFRHRFGRRRRFSILSGAKWRREIETPEMANDGERDFTPRKCVLTLEMLPCVVVET